MGRNILWLLFGVLFLWMLSRCASQGYPEGGPRDETPPRMVASTPKEAARNFQGSIINIEFDELIQLKEVLQKVVISPPLDKMPTITGRGRVVRIEFEEELQPATTYTIDFADAISDNNENNPITNFTFSFSTGESVDTLQIAGHLYEAETLTPVKGALVMAHQNHADSAFTQMVPPRVAKTDETGRFTIKNLADKIYRVFALEDVNRNYRFDQPGERIAWHPQLIEPSFEYRERIDSLFTDSITLDTVLIYDELVYLPDSVKLFLFQEDYKEQYLASRDRNSGEKLDFVFNRSLEQPLEIDILNAQPALEAWYVYEHSATHDTVAIWLADTTLVAKDTLSVKLTYPVRDSLNRLVWQPDTLQMFHFEPEKSRKQRKKEDEAGVEPLRITGPGSSLEIGSGVWLSSPVPLASVDTSAITLTHRVDTVYHSAAFRWRQDSIRIRSFELVHNWMPGESYRLAIDSAAFKGLYGLVNKPLRYEFSVKPEESYATLYIDVAQPDSLLLLQVLNRQEVPVRQGYVPPNGKIAFKYIKPGDYFFRLIVDANRNGRWDTGDFSTGRQPESVYYYPESISVRANWDQIVSIDREQNPLNEFVEKNRVKKSSRRNNRQGR